MLDEPLEQREHVAEIVGHLFDGAQRGTPGEDGQPSIEGPLRFAQQTIAPVERRTHRPLALREIDGTLAGHGVVEPLEQELWRQQPRSRGGELQREGYAGQAAAERRHRGGVVGARAEAR